MKNGFVLILCSQGSTYYSLFQCSWNFQLFQLLFALQRPFWISYSYFFSFLLNLHHLNDGPLSLVLPRKQVPPTTFILVWFIFCSLEVFFWENLRSCFEQISHFIIVRGIFISIVGPKVFNTILNKVQCNTKGFKSLCQIVIWKIHPTPLFAKSGPVWRVLIVIWINSTLNIISLFIPILQNFSNEYPCKC